MSSVNDSDAPFKLVRGDGNAGEVWILFGAQQANAAAACEPDGVAVYRLTEHGLMESERLKYLSAVEDKKVLIFPKGDAATDHEVYECAAEVGRHCADEGAAEVRFTWLSRDLDIHLSNRSLEEQKKRLARLTRKRTGLKPAKAKPKAPSQSQQRTSTILVQMESRALEEGRPVINVNADRLEVVNDLVEALLSGHDSEQIYNFGGRIARIRPNKNGATEAELVGEEQMLDLLSRSAQMVAVTTRGVNAAWPESKTLTALYGRCRDFRPLRGVAATPIVRADNTIATTEGYDEQSQVLLDLGGLGPQIPENPTDDEVRDAVRLLLDDWLGDFPFASEGDKANCLALILTYPMRELVKLVPLAVISAKSKGTGKSKLVSLIVLLFTRVMPIFDSLPSHEEEIRKQITTLLATGSPHLVFDESPRIGGKSINRLLTASTWSDRVLGGNERAVLPNRAVMTATGNNVQIIGDTSRRYYPIELFYDGESPENRPESEFTHADIEAWTEEHRGELLTAVFTLIRAWQVAGRPKRSTSFGSFERWEAVIGGVLENAGVVSFLDNLGEHRASTDYDEGLWIAHCEWLAVTFPGGVCTTREVVAKSSRLTSNNMRITNPDADLPPGIDAAPTDAGYAAKLGKLYHSRHGGWSGGYRITKSERKAGGNQTRWTIERSPRLLKAEAEARAAEQAASEADRRANAARDLPALRARAAELEAAGASADPLQFKLARLELENAQLLTFEQDGEAA